MADLNNATYWSETDASNNSASPNGWPEGMMPSGVNDSARSDKGALKRFWDRINPVQTITPSGGVWTFTTGNVTYPASYVEGEVFTFAANAVSAAGDQFRVNALPAKPIYVLRNQAWTTILPYDLFNGMYPRLTYIAGLNAGAGGFGLHNPYQPVQPNGTLGGTIPGTLAIGGDITVAGNATVSGGTLYLRSQPAISAGAPTGFTAIYDNSSGTALLLGGSTPDPSNYYRNTTHRFQDRPGTTNFLIVNAAGATVTGGISATGGINAAGATVTGDISATGGINAATGAFTSLTVTGGGTAALNVTGGGITTQYAVTANGTGTALYAPNGGLIVATSGSFGTTLAVSGGGFAAINVSGGGITAANRITSNDAGLALYAPTGNLGVGGTATAGGFIQTNAAGRAFYAPSGNLEIGGTGSIGSTLTVSGQSAFNGLVSMYQGGLALNLTGGTAQKPGGGMWGDSSDIRTKDVDSLADYTRGLEAVLQLRPRTFRKNGRGGTIADGRTYVGLVADDVLPVMPEMIGRIAERLDPGDAETTDILTLDATALLYALTNAVKTLATDIESLKTGEPDAATRSTPQPRLHRQPDQRGHHRT